MQSSSSGSREYNLITKMWGSRLKIKEPYLPNLGFKVTDCRLRVAGCGLRVAGCGLRVAGCGSRVLDLGFRVYSVGSTV